MLKLSPIDGVQGGGGGVAPGAAPGAEQQQQGGGLEGMRAHELIMLAINALGIAYNKIPDEYAGTEIAQKVPPLIEEASGALGQTHEEMERVEQEANGAGTEGAPAAPAAPTQPAA